MKVTKISHDKYNNKSQDEKDSEERVSKRKEYSGKKIYIGLDVHKKSWTVAIVAEKKQVERFTQNPDAQELYRHLIKKYPMGEYKCVYEAGFSGFWIANKLNELGVRCIVVNPADVPTKDKERKNKTDQSDATKLAIQLSQETSLEAIHIPSDESFGARSLLRIRTQYVNKLTRCKNQIKSFLNLYGIKTPENIEEKHWSANYLKYLDNLKFNSVDAREAFSLYLEEFRALRNIMLTLNQKIQRLSKSQRYKEDVRCLRSIYGISTLSAMVILTELDGIKRFKGLDSLCKYTGLIPSESSSGEKERKGNISSRKNNRLRQLLVEISWVAVRHDAALKKLFEEYQHRMQKKKAIIKIARHILNRIRYVLLRQQLYKPLHT